MKNHRTSREVLSWAFYDWANSAFPTTIIVCFFPLFFKQYWSHGEDSTVTTARLGTLVSVVSFLVAVVSPALGAWADLRGKKKLFTFLFMALGVLGSAALAFVGPGDWYQAGFWYALGTMGFTASSTFYDSLLPSISKGEEAHYTSSLGFALGYLGGGVLLTFNVLCYLKPELFGIPDATTAVKVAFVSVAVWWTVFSIPLFRYVKEPPLHFAPYSWGAAFRASWSQLRSTLKEMFAQKNLMLFVVAYWLYIDGVYTIMNMAFDFGISLGFDASKLITALLLVQFIGFPFALLFSKFAKWWGARIPILICLFFYSLTLLGALRMSEVWHFFCLAAVIGMVQGGVQALSRSLFSRMTPVEKSGEYFGFFNLVGKFASILGPLLVGWGTYLFNDHRQGLLGVMALLIIGAILLYKVKEPVNDAV